MIRAIFRFISEAHKYSRNGIRSITIFTGPPKEKWKTPNGELQTRKLEGKGIIK